MVENSYNATPGEKAEKYVYQKIKTYFDKREALVFNNYPVYTEKGNRYGEIDLLILDKVSGISVIEIKALNINQIDSLQGTRWEVNNYFNKKYISPYHQAKRQMDILVSNLEKKHVLPRTTGLRIMIALPYITKEQWVRRGFDKVATNYPILFKDDFEQTTSLSKIDKVSIKERFKPLNNEEWFRLSSYFDSSYTIKPIKENTYSKMFILPSKEEFYKEIINIERALKKGVKVFLLAYFQELKDMENRLKKYKSLLEVHVSEAIPNFTESIIIDDGQFEKESSHSIKNQIVLDFPYFNMEQFEIVHANLDEHMMVSAGAGTGKTHVMIERIMFLLAKGVKLEDIIMITFTNEATREMKTRIQDKLVELSKITKLSHFITLSENIKSLKISTIHTYFKESLKQLAHEFGYGLNFKVRGYKKIKEDIVRELINEFYLANPDAKRILKIKDFTLEKYIYELWNEMGKRGLSQSEIMYSLDWGDVEEKEDQVYLDLFNYVFSQCELRFSDIKRKDNSVEVNDLIREIKDISFSKQKISQLETNKYIFIDEFQDSDNAQINFIASLANYLDYKLFVVGDVKQSIYRFRGADNRAFDILGKKINFHENPQYLTKNYRTNKKILDQLHEDIFTGWKESGLLQYDKPLEAMYVQEEQTPYEPFSPIMIKARERDMKRKAQEDVLLNSLKQSIENIKRINDRSRNKKIAVITRTNREVREIANLCRKKGFRVKESFNGSFYRSRAVHDFKMLINGLLYPKNARSLINALESPYFRYKIPIKLLIPFKGDNDKIVDYINSKIGNDFNQYVNQLKTLPVLAVIQKIISEKDFFYYLKEYYSNQLKNKDLELFIKQYRRNIEHLINLIQQNFDVMNSTLYHINEWLDIQIATNNQEDEPRITIDDDVIEVLTVHRSKGLQYHTVIIPKTTFPFNSKRRDVYLSEEDEKNIRKVGWKLNNGKKIIIRNNYFTEIEAEEEDEVRKEETRLLYVALTRAIDQLIIILPSSSKSNTWSELLLNKKLEVIEYDGNSRNLYES